MTASPITHHPSRAVPSSKKKAARRRKRPSLPPDPKHPRDQRARPTRSLQPTDATANNLAPSAERSDRGLRNPSQDCRHPDGSRKSSPIKGTKLSNTRNDDSLHAQHLGVPGHHTKADHGADKREGRRLIGVGARALGSSTPPPFPREARLRALPSSTARPRVARNHPPPAITITRSAGPNNRTSLYGGPLSSSMGRTAQATEALARASIGSVP